MTCQHKHCDDANPAGHIKWEVIGVIKAKTCLLPMVTQDTRWLLGVFDHYKNGTLLVAGGLLDQPNFYTEAMTLLNRVQG